MQKNAQRTQGDFWMVHMIWVKSLDDEHFFNDFGDILVKSNGKYRFCTQLWMLRSHRLEGVGQK